MRELDAIRQYYAEELRAVANLQSEALVRAFAKVPREHFLGPGPWQILNPSHLIDDNNEATYYRDTADADPKQLYHNILVAIDAKRSLNNGQPSFVATLIDSLELNPGDRVLHIGCGTGYYSAIMAEVIGADGHLIAVEVDSELAVLARSNLEMFLKSKCSRPTVAALNRSRATQFLSTRAPHIRGRLGWIRFDPAADSFYRLRFLTTPIRPIRAKY